MYKYSKSNIYSVFLQLLPAQILANVTTSLSGIVNGLLIGNYLTSVDMIALGFATPMVNILTIIAAIISGGARIVCGRFIGRGDKTKVNQTFYASCVMLIVVGLTICAVWLIFAEPIAKLIGTSATSISSAAAYIRGMSFGTGPTMLIPCGMIYLQMKNESGFALLCAVLLAIINFGLCFISLRFTNLGIFGVGLMTSISQWIVMFIGMVKLKKMEQRMLKFPTKEFALYKDIVVLGIPCTLASFLYNLRNSILNTKTLSIYGDSAVQALSILNSSSGPISAVNVGVGSTLLMVLSIYYGEKDKEAVKQSVRTSMICGSVLAYTLVILVAMFKGQIVTLFGATGEVKTLAESLYLNYAFCMPFNIINVSLSNAYQVLGKINYLNFTILLNAIITPITYVTIANKFIGINAVWTCFWVAEIVTIVFMFVYASIKTKRLAISMGDLVFHNQVIQEETSKVISIKKKEELIVAAREIELFCSLNDIDKRRCNLVGLCLEEMVTNIFEHGFTKTKKKVGTVDIYVGILDKNINIRIKDNGVAFDPHIKLHESDDPTVNIGIKMVSKIAKEMNYQNDFGINVLSIKM